MKKILMYHRIVDEEIDPWNLCVSPANFEAHLKIIKQNYRILSLEELIKSDSSKPEIAITFDDGYSDNYYNALPILEKLNIGATFFIISSALDSNKLFYWDEIARIVLEPGELPSKIEYIHMGKPYTWINNIEHYALEDYNRFKSWKIGEVSPPTERQRLYGLLWEFAHNLKLEHRDKFIHYLGTLKSAKNHNPLALPLTKSELNLMSSKAKITIGSHSVNHISLDTISYSDKEYEIVNSKKDIERYIQKKINLFSYPHGDYDLDTISILRSNGFIASCTTVDNGTSQLNKNYSIPRIHVKNWLSSQFSKYILN